MEVLGLMGSRKSKENPNQSEELHRSKLTMKIGINVIELVIVTNKDMRTMSIAAVIISSLSKLGTCITLIYQFNYCFYSHLVSITHLIF